MKKLEVNMARNEYITHIHQGIESDNDPNNTTMFMGGLDSNVIHDILWQTFSLYGELVYVKIPISKLSRIFLLLYRFNMDTKLIYELCVYIFCLNCMKLYLLLNSCILKKIVDTHILCCKYIYLLLKINVIF